MLRSVFALLFAYGIYDGLATLDVDGMWLFKIELIVSVIGMAATLQLAYLKASDPD